MSTKIVIEGSENKKVYFMRSNWNDYPVKLGIRMETNSFEICLSHAQAKAAAKALLAIVDLS